MTIVVVSAVSYLVHTYTDPFRANTLQSCVFSNKKDAFAVESFLNRDEAILNMASRVADVMVEQNAISGQIQSLKNRTRSENPRFGDLYGFVNGKPYANYSLPDSVNPTREPWFQGALLAHGDVALVPIYRGKDQVIALSKRLSDMKSVIALNVKLSGLRKCVSSWSQPNIWMIMDDFRP